MAQRFGAAAGGVGDLLGQLLGNETMRSIVMWQVFGDIMQATLAPFTTALQQDLYAKTPDVALNVAAAADAVVKGHKSFDEAAKEAGQWGINRERFQVLVDISGEPPGPETLLEMWRRKLIPESGAGPTSVSVEQGIREGRTKNKWIEPMKALRTLLPQPTQALRALLEGQIDRPGAEDLYQQWGGDPRYFELLFNTEGSAPTPLEAAEMARRGIIPWDGRGPGVVSFEQAFLEGPWRNKWLTPFQRASEYLPPPRTVTAMVREGALTDERALQIWKQSGLSEEIAAAYLTAAHHQKTQAERDLTKAEITKGYAERLLTPEQATTLLKGMGYDAQESAYLLQLVDFALARDRMASAIGRIHTLFVRRKLSRTDVVANLGKLGRSSAQVNELLAVWDLERAATIPTITAAQVASAAFYEGITVNEALVELQAMGYSPFDAWVVLVDRFHGSDKLPARPTVTIPEPYTR